MAKKLKEARRTARQQRTAERKQGRPGGVGAKPFDLADEVRYMQRRAAERTGRIVTIGPLLLFCTDSGDAWILDPTDHLATQIAQEGAARPVHIEETETSFAIGWQGAYDITGAAFVFRHSESGRVMTILGYPTRHIVERISDIFGDASNRH